MNKIKKILLVFMTVNLLFVTVGVGSVDAATTKTSTTGWKQDCQQTSTGKKCGSKYRDTTVTIRWSASEVKTQVKELGKFTGTTSGLVNILIGAASAPVGIVTSLGTMSVNSVRDKFISAQATNSSLTYTYTFRYFDTASSPSLRTKNLRSSWTIGSIPSSGGGGVR